MISRRNIRVKVMQIIYTLETGGSLDLPDESVRSLEKQFVQSRQLFVYLIYFITELTRYVETDSRIRSGKHLPTEADRNINTKLAGNEIIQEVLKDASFKLAMQKDKPQAFENRSIIKKLYLLLAESAEYKDYLQSPRGKKSEKEILEVILTNIVLPSESFENHMEDTFTNWHDDAEMLVQLLPGYFSKPHSYDLQDFLGQEKWAFAKDLLLTTLEKKETTLDLIHPKLKNWEPERIAILDMILMRMGVCEFLYFETIPPKVTINEYIDLAKEYSTQQSGQFVNGILDNIHKDLARENRLHKVSFKHK
ncbi:MAG TPA: transcription antitermination factor NusB [Puia sp.]|nr:transcription antitermination factor NusB [Puia sp.]